MESELVKINGTVRLIAYSTKKKKKFIHSCDGSTYEINYY